MLSIAAIAPFSLCGVLHAQTITVCASGCDHTTIQAAIDAAAPGATVSVAPGTYPEALHIDKALAVVGAGIGATIVDVTGQPRYGIFTETNDLTLSDMTVVGPAAFYSVKVQGRAVNDPLGAGNGLPALRNTIKNLEIIDSERTGLDVNGVHRLVVENVTVINSDGGNGITLTDVRRARVKDITTIGNEWGGFAIYTSGEWFPIGASNISLQNADIQENKTLYVELDNFNDPGNPAPVIRFVLDSDEWDHYFRDGNFTGFDREQHGAFGMPTPSDCVHVTDAGVSPCSSLALDAFALRGAPVLVSIEPVFPNPVQTGASVRVGLPDSSPYHLAVFDVLGREVAVLGDGDLGAGFTTVEFDASGWAPGVYVVRLASMFGTATRRITVAR